MNNIELYPKSIEDLYKKIDFLIANEENQKTISDLTNWISWYKSIKYNFNYVCKENEYLKPYFDNGKCSLQLWKHDESVDSILFNLLSNYFCEYDNESTIHYL